MRAGCCVDVYHVCVLVVTWCVAVGFVTHVLPHGDGQDVLDCYPHYAPGLVIRAESSWCSTTKNTTSWPCELERYIPHLQQFLEEQFLGVGVIAGPLARVVGPSTIFLRFVPPVSQATSRQILSFLISSSRCCFYCVAFPMWWCDGAAMVSPGLVE